jgi:uncharacterized membrane protein YqjE
MVDGPAVPTDENAKRHDASVSELVRSLLTDVSLLIRKETELATIEMKAKAKEVAAGAALFGAAVAVAFLGVATLVACAVIALAIALPAWAAALVVGVVLLVVAGVLVLLGRARLREATPLAPNETIGSVKEDIGWLREKTEQLKTSE